MGLCYVPVPLIFAKYGIETSIPISARFSTARTSSGEFYPGEIGEI
jgi:hypothetical protein